MEFYDNIAKSWYNIRHWTIFREELEELNNNWKRGKILNLGCAHGADFLPFSKSFDFFGLDSSKELVKLSIKYAEKNNIIFHNVVGDMKKIPFKKKSFDYVISIASLHHLLKREERLKTLNEINRVMKKEGFVTVWDRENPSLPPGNIITKEWNKSGKILKREYYIYSKEELEEDLANAGFKYKITSDGYNLMAKIKLK